VQVLREWGTWVRIWVRIWNLHPNTVDDPQHLTSIPPGVIETNFKSPWPTRKDAWEKDEPHTQLWRVQPSRSVFPLRKLKHWADVCFSVHAIAQPCRLTTNEVFQVVKGPSDIYSRFKSGMLRVRENEILLRKWSGGTTHFRSCAPQKERWSRDKISEPNAYLTTLNLAITHTASNWIQNRV